MQRIILCIFIGILVLGCGNLKDSSMEISWMENSKSKMAKVLVKLYGENQEKRINRGLQQVAEFWREEDGDEKVFEAFVKEHFAGDQKTLDSMFERYQVILEKINGHMNEINLALRWQTDLNLGPILPFDQIFAAYNPSAHMTDDMFSNKLAFIVLLNFPLTTLEERLREGESWSRRQWAEARLAQQFGQRVPAAVNQAISEADSKADQYIADYNIWMHHLVTSDGVRLFPEGMRLLSHWNLRDEIKAQYGNNEEGFKKQKMIQRIMERIVTQSIPEIVVNNPWVDWNPNTNEIAPAAIHDVQDDTREKREITYNAEPDTRYKVLLDVFKAVKLLDPYSPQAPTHIKRSFDLGREIPEERVKAMFEMLLSSEAAVKTAELIKQRLGRDLEPFDIWYNGFKPRGTYSDQDLDKITQKKYPTPQAYKNDIPSLLQKLGFTQQKASYLAENIEVDPARGSGHAWGAAMRFAKAHLRTRVDKSGMDYKGYNIAVHEMGHNVEQIFSLNDIDYTLLSGVPNTAFTEAMAFVFQNRDLELLGLAKPDEKSAALSVLDDFWGAFEIAGVALVDIAVWHWMYDNPEATPAQLKEATIQISKDIWNKYYAPVLGQKDVILLGIYSHMIHSKLYLPDYPIGHLIANQIEAQINKSGNVGEEFERMAKLGNIAPDLWMQQATGSPVGAEAMLEAVEKALANWQESVQSSGQIEE